MTTNTITPEVPRAPQRPTLIAAALLFAFIALMPRDYHFLPSPARPWALALVMVLAIASAMSPVNLAMRRVAKVATTSLVVLLTAMLLGALGMVIERIYVEGVAVHGISVLSTTAALWATNIVTFALLYWLVDRGGPERRMSREPKPIDLLFPQNAAPEVFPTHWTLGLPITSSSPLSPGAVPLHRQARQADARNLPAEAFARRREAPEGGRGESK